MGKNASRLGIRKMPGKSFKLYSLGFILIPFFWGVNFLPTNDDVLILKAEKLPFTPTEYFIAGIVDERKDQSAVAWLVPAAGTKLVKQDLKGGGLAGIRQFIKQSMPSNEKLRPIVIRLKECRITEIPGTQQRVDGIVNIEMGFYLQRNGEEIHLLDYKGGAKYGRTVNQQYVAEAVLRQSLGNALNYLNTWMNKEVATNEKLAKGIKVIFAEPNTANRRDTVFYNSTKPLTWSDFKAKPNSKSIFAASVFPGFGYKGHSEVKDGIVYLTLNMEVFVVQQASWVKEIARNAYALNHEQRHFDIVKLVAENFKKRVQPDSLTVADYNSIIQYKYIESFREMNRLQEQYDGETRHGIDKEAQARWNKKIDAELFKAGVKNNR